VSREPRRCASRWQMAMRGRGKNTTGWSFRWDSRTAQEGLKRKPRCPLESVDTSITSPFLFRRIRGPARGQEPVASGSFCRLPRKEGAQDQELKRTVWPGPTLDSLPSPPGPGRKSRPALGSRRAAGRLTPPRNIGVTFHGLRRHNYSRVGLSRRPGMQRPSERLPAFPAERSALRISKWGRRLKALDQRNRLWALRSTAHRIVKHPAHGAARGSATST
jgi:hypothetical protein